MNAPSTILRTVCGAVFSLIIVIMAQAAATEGREPLFYRNPMDPTITSPVPTKDSMGMDYLPVYADQSGGDAALVSIEPAIVQNLGVRTEPVTRGKLWRRIDTVGTLAYDENRIAHIHVRAEGWVERLNVHFVGERVSAGDVLFEVYSPVLSNAQAELLQALKIGQRDLINASRERLASLGIDKQQIRELERSREAQARIQVRAPRDGVVTELNARHGMYVKPDMQVMTLSDLSSLWLLAEVYERQSAWVAVGQPAEMRLSAYPGEVFEGEIDFVYPSLDPKTRTLRARVRFANPDQRLKPDMLAEVQIFAGPTDAVLSVPTQALIRDGRTDRVIVAEGEGKFRAVVVVAGMESGEWMEIREGLMEGDQVVVSGQFLIDSEASVRASVQRLQDSRQ